MQPTIGPGTSAGFRVLALRVRDAGLLARRRAYYGVLGGLVLAALVVSWAGFVVLGSSWWSLAMAAVLGCVSTQLGFLGHDAGHNQVFATRRANRLLGLVVGNALTGLSFGWWVPKHNAHHAHPNEIGVDPDVGDGLVAASDPGGNLVMSLLVRWRMQLFFPLMLLRSWGLHVSGARQFLHRRDRKMIAEAFLVAMHAGAYLAVVFWVLSPLKALAFIAVQQGVFSVYLGCSFAPNHKGMPVVERDGAPMAFALRQVATARNVAGGRGVTFALGGLNYQVEHHLFPAMPRPNLARAQCLVRQYCIDSELVYDEVTLVGSFRRILRCLAGNESPGILDVSTMVAAYPVSA